MGRRAYDPETDVSKPKFIRLVAKEAGFTIGDTYEVWNAIEKVIGLLVANRKRVTFPGFGILYVKRIEKRKMWIGLEKQYRNVTESYRLNFKFTKKFKEVYHQYKDQKIPEDILPGEELEKQES